MEVKGNLRAERILCPECGKRLMDVEVNGAARIAIKCEQCKRVIEIRRESAGKRLTNVNRKEWG
ncbi:MAG: hypothetical protein EOM12_02700 [Verrucomicrobiae bacterium]|nr:hypothetical protein [Verrucomicrobiae bacterium]